MTGTGTCFEVHSSHRTILAFGINLIRIVWIDETVSANSTLPDPIGKRGFASYPTPQKIPGTGEMRLMGGGDEEHRGEVLLIAEELAADAP